MSTLFLPPSGSPWPSRPLVVVGALAFLEGLWLISAPAALGYPLGDPITNDIVVGFLVSLLALARASAGSRAAGRGLVALGAWLVVASIVLYRTTVPFVNDLACGGVLLMLAAADAALGRAAR